MNHPSFPPGTRSYFDPLSKTEEIWLEDGELDNERTWIRCRILGAVEQMGEVHFVSVEAQRCVQKIRKGVLQRIGSLFAREETAEGYYIASINGDMSGERALPVGQRMKNMLLAWGSADSHEIPEMRFVSKHGAVSLLERQKQITSSGPIKEQPIRPIHLDTREEDTRTVGNLDELPPLERIEVIEHGLEEFEKFLLSQIQYLNIQRPGLPIAIQNPFHFVRANKSNPLKWYGNAVKEASRQQVPEPAVLSTMPEPYYFSYAFPEDISYAEGVMAYAPLLRTVVMNGYNSTQNPFENTVFMHEMVHCMHAAAQRKRDLKAHLEFNIPKTDKREKKVVIQEEFDAYAVGLESLNLTLDNGLFLSAQRGDAMDPEKICSQFQLRPEQLMPILALCHMGQLYFRNSSIGNYATEYLEFVAKMTAFDGYDLYSPDYQLLAYGRKVEDLNEDIRKSQRVFSDLRDKDGKKIPLSTLLKKLNEK